ncbi:MAG TPA: hypothetical protein VMU66_07710 [Gaiellales bacterium]|nr:hypothetical protein [Gaiellales bacterium]
MTISDVTPTPSRTRAQTAQGLRWSLRDRWAGHPSYHRFIRHKRRRAVVDDRTELVIEAFPRSASTFTVVAFQTAQRRPVRLAHHLHAPVQVAVAARLGVPTLVLVRHPRDAAISVTFRSPHVTLKQALEAYARFHSRVLEHRDRIEVARFEDVTTDLGTVIDSVNERFGTHFDRFDHTPENVARCYALIEERSVRPPWADSIQAYVSGWITAEQFAAVKARGLSGPPAAGVPEARVARPSGERRSRREAAVALYESAQLEPSRNRAERVYRDFLAATQPAARERSAS